MPLLIPFVIFGGEAKGDVSPPNFGEVDLWFNMHGYFVISHVCLCSCTQYLLAD